MVQPAQIIGQLLLKHSCVIIPDFGGFVAKRSSAVIDHSKGVMLPPKKGILFNRQLTNNDGLLISELSAQEKISFEDAAAVVKEMVQEWNSKLNRGARVTIDTVGNLYFDQEKNLCFEQDRFFNLLLESYGLGNVHFVPKKEDATVIEISSGKKVAPATSQTWKYLAAACILPVAFYSFWIPAKTNVLESGVFAWRDFNPFVESGLSKYVKEGPIISDRETLPVSNELSEDCYEFLPGIVFPLSAHEPLQEETTSIRIDQNQFIVGCFASEGNAQIMVDRLKQLGIDAYIFDYSNGLTRVSAGAGNSDESFTDLRLKLASHGINGWIFHQ